MIENQTTCKICNSNTLLIGSKIVLKKHNVVYFKCESCGFIQTEPPFWLNEAYARPINLSDTGLLARNIYISKIALCLIYFFFDKNAKFLDVAGGYGVFTRLMRDFGLNFFWSDPYTKNLFSNSFEDEGHHNKYELITSFESFEHFENPVIEFENMLKISKNIFFSTELQPENLNLDSNWFYWGFEHGQHIAFHTFISLEYLAKSKGLNYYTCNNLHLITEKKINKLAFKIIVKIASKGFYKFVAKSMQSKTMSDSLEITKNLN